MVRITKLTSISIMHSKKILIHLPGKGSVLCPSLVAPPFKENIRSLTGNDERNIDSTRHKSRNLDLFYSQVLWMKSSPCGKLLAHGCAVKTLWITNLMRDKHCRFSLNKLYKLIFQVKLFNVTLPRKISATLLCQWMPHRIFWNLNP